MLLSDKDIGKLQAEHLYIYIDGDSIGGQWEFARAIEAAILAKLASAELPEPAMEQMLSIGTKFSSENWGERSFHEIDFYSAACEIFKLGQAQAYAQGAAAQLAEKPTCWVTPDGEGFRMRLSPPVNAVPLGWQELYTRKEAK